MQPREELAQRLARLVLQGALRPRVGHTQAQVVQALASLPGASRSQADQDFAALRRALKAEAPQLCKLVKTRMAGQSKSKSKSQAELSRLRFTFSIVAARACLAEPPAAALHQGEPARVQILAGDNLPLLQSLPSASYALIYTDPPFNTGKVQTRTQLRTERTEGDETGDRVGYGGKRYRTQVLGSQAYADAFDDYLAFLEPRLREAHRLLRPDGSLFVHLDYREIHYAKVLLDQIFGRECFINELIWAYDYGARSKRKWSAKHDNILWYVKDPRNYCFNYEAMDRIPYMAPGLVSAEKAARGKTPTDVWWHTIVSPTGKEKTGYPTQKPLGVVRRIVQVHSKPGDEVLDMFAGSGTLGEAAAEAGRHATLIDQNPQAIDVMRERLRRFSPSVMGRGRKT